MKFKMYPETKVGIFTRVCNDLEKDGMIICKLEKSLRTNKNVILAALPTYKEAIKYIKNEDLQDEEFVKEIYIANKEAFWNIANKSKITDKTFKYSLLKEAKTLLDFFKIAEILNIDVWDVDLKEFVYSNFVLEEELYDFCAEVGNGLDSLKMLVEIFELKEKYEELIICTEYFNTKACLDYIYSLFNEDSFKNISLLYNNITFVHMEYIIDYFKKNGQNFEKLINIFCVKDYKEITYNLIYNLNEEEEKLEIIKELLDVISNSPELVDELAYTASLIVAFENDEYSYISLFKEYIKNEKCPRLKKWYDNMYERYLAKVTDIKNLV